MHEKADKKTETSGKSTSQISSPKQDSLVATYQLVDNRSEAILQKKLVEIFNHKSSVQDSTIKAGSSKSISLGSEPVQLQIDDVSQQETLREFLWQLFGENTPDDTIQQVFEQVIKTADSIEEAKELAREIKLQRGEIISNNPTTGTEYEAGKLSEEKMEALRAFAGLPGYTDPEVDTQYFTWHHLVPQSRLTSKETASKPGAVRLGPLTNHRYGDPGNEYIDPNYSQARDGSLTPDSEAIETYNESLRKKGGLEAALTQMIQQLSEKIELEKKEGITKPLSDPNQWLIFGDFLRGLPGMTDPLLTELNEFIGPGYTANKGSMETYEFASWGDLRPKNEEEGGAGISPELFQVLDTGIKSYQAGGSKPIDHDGKIFARGYKEGDPAKIRSLRQKSIIDKEFFSDRLEGFGITTILQKLEDKKNTYGAMIARGTNMVQKAGHLNRLTEEATKADGSSFTGTEHQVTEGTGEVSIDQEGNLNAYQIVQRLSGITKKLVAHKSIQAGQTTEQKMFDSYKSKVPAPDPNPEIDQETLDSRVRQTKEGMRDELQNLEKDIDERKKNEKLKSKPRRNKEKLLKIKIDNTYKAATKKLEEKSKILRESLANENDEIPQELIDMVRMDLIKEIVDQQKAAYKPGVIAKFKEDQDERIRGINSTSAELNMLGATGISEDDQSMVQQMSVKDFCQTQMGNFYSKWKDDLRSEIATLRLIPPFGENLQDQDEEAWLACEATYRELINNTALANLSALGEKMKEKWEITKQSLNLPD